MEQAPAIGAAVQRFFEARVRGRFPLDDYTFDAYVSPSLAVRLVDFNPVGGTTAPLLFDWRELGFMTEPEAEPKAEAEAEAEAETEPAAEPAAGPAAEEGAAGGEPAAAGGASPGAREEYLEQLRRLRSLAVAEGHVSAGASDEGGPLPPAARLPAPPPAGQVQVRVVMEPVHIRPVKMAYGVPYDLVDGSEGSALDALRSQAAGAGDLWAALGAEARAPA